MKTPRMMDGILGEVFLSKVHQLSNEQNGPLVVCWVFFRGLKITTQLYGG